MMQTEKGVDLRKGVGRLIKGDLQGPWLKLKADPEGSCQRDLSAYQHDDVTDTEGLGQSLQIPSDLGQEPPRLVTSWAYLRVSPEVL